MAGRPNDDNDEDRGRKLKLTMEPSHTDFSKSKLDQHHNLNLAFAVR